MSNYTGWRSLSRSLIVSKKWKHVDNDARVLWVMLLLGTDTHGATEADPSNVMDECLPNLPGWTEKKVDTALAQLADAGMIELYQVDGIQYLQIAAFDEHQLSEFRRKRGKRTTPVRPNAGPTPAEGQTDEEPLQNGEVWTKSGPKKVNGKAKKPNHVVPTNVETMSADADANESDGVKAVYEHWRSLEETIVGETQDGAPVPGLRGPRLTDKRSKCIRTRRQSFSVAELCDAVSGFMGDPWFLGANPQGTRYTDVTTILRTDDKVEAGMAKLRQRQAAASTSRAKEPSRVRPATR